MVTVQGDNEDKIDELINDFETEFIALEEIEITNNLNKLSTLALEANIHVVDQGNTYTNELETNKKRKNNRRKYPIYMEMQRSSTFSRELSSLRQRIASVFDIYRQVTNLDVLVEILVQQSNLYSPPDWRKFLTNAEEMKIDIGVNYIMTVSQLPKILVYWDCDGIL